MLEGVPPETGQRSVWGLSENEDEEALVKSRRIIQLGQQSIGREGLELLGH